MNPNAPYKSIRRLNLLGFFIVSVLVGGFGSWASIAQIAGAVVAPGSIVVESMVKKVQHPSGGVVSEILVNEGDGVEEGQVVMRLDDTMTQATLGVVRSQLDEYTAREARLLAERDADDSISFSENLTLRRDEKSVGATMAGEERLFESRKRARSGQVSQLRERIVQGNEEIRGLAAQQDAKAHEIVFISQELIAVSELYAKNLVSMSRLMILQRDKARLDGERGQYLAEIARARGKISETELQILQVDHDFRSEVLKDLRETQSKIAELKERLTAARDQLYRVDIRAPQSGIVLQLAVHTIGGVISAGETIMKIVPQADVLVFEAKVTPQDIDQISIGAKAFVRIMAGDQRTMPDLAGLVTRVTADLIKDQSQNGQQAGQAYYLVRVSLPEDSVRRLTDFRLVPGMPAELFIQTYARTPMQYLLKPIREQMARTFRER